MNKEEMMCRTKQFTLRIIKLTSAIPNKNYGYLIGKQLFRSGTSVGANYRAACRSRSNDEFIAKLCIVEEELDECMYWIEILIDGGYINKERLDLMYAEANELISIIIATKIKMRQKNKKSSDDSKL